MSRLGCLLVGVMGSRGGLLLSGNIPKGSGEGRLVYTVDIKVAHIELYRLLYLSSHISTLKLIIRAT